MIVAARYAAAIELLDAIMDGAPAEKTLTNWARRSRFAGSKDRAAVRDIVFDCLRAWQSLQALSGYAGSRGATLGHALQNGFVAEDIFSGIGHAPAPFGSKDASWTGGDTWDLPDIAVNLFRRAFGAKAEDISKVLTNRAGVHLRVNAHKATREKAKIALQEQGIETAPLEIEGALEVLQNPRAVARSTAYLDGLVELQDAASQGVVLALPLKNANNVLDYCAGGGGKTLAIAANWPNLKIAAFDSSQTRLENLDERARRAGAKVTLLRSDPVLQSKRYDLVLLDVPCTGSGAWRRNPDGKWKFSQDQLDAVTKVQADILEATANLVKTDGALCYVTCSIFREENEDQVEKFCKKHPSWVVTSQARFDPERNGDGFFLSVLNKKQL